MQNDRRTLGAALIGAALASAATPGPTGAQDELPPLPAPAVSPEGPAPSPFGGPAVAPMPYPQPTPAPYPPGAPTPFPPGAPAYGPAPGPEYGPAAYPGPIHVGGPPPGPVVEPHRGPIARAAHHVGFTIKDRMIGEHERFYVPPLGWSVGRNFAAQAAMAEQHRFTLYRSDFFAGTDRLTPEGLRRLGRMVARWDCWAGPLLVEIDPRRPGLAEARRDAVLELAAANGAVLDPMRLVIGGSPYYGGRGDLSEIYDGIRLERSLQAPATYPLNPNPNADFQN